MTVKPIRDAYPGAEIQAEEMHCYKSYADFHLLQKCRNSYAYKRRRMTHPLGNPAKGNPTQEYLLDSFLDGSPENAGSL